LRELLTLYNGEYLINEIIEVASNISWSKYISNGIPKFHGTWANGMLTAWKIISTADWLDAQYIIRARDHTKSVHPEYSEEQIKKNVEIHWKEKLKLLHLHGFDPILSKYMKDRYQEQKKILKTWLLS
jgi:hypothetical protein